MLNRKTCFRSLLITLRVFLITLGALLLIGIVLAFTSAPFWIWYGLGTGKAGITGEPRYIIVLGGSGIPSGSGLMRTWYAAEAAREYPDARVIVAMPGDTADSLSAVCRMRDELLLRGVQPRQILFENSGTNTRAQAIHCWNYMENNPRPRILLITSPEHIYRAVLTFRKAGFKAVDALPAFEQDVESELSFSSRRLGGRRWVPDVGENITLRYRFWTQLHYEILILREWTAIAYYYTLGWL